MIVLAVALSTVCLSQNNCDCNEAMTGLISTVEKSYPGFEEKSRDKVLYTNFREALLSKSMTTGESGCEKLLKEYVSFFHDGHISVFATGSSVSANQGTGRSDTVTYDPAAFRERIRTSPDRLEGIWSSFSYRVGISRHDSGYVGFIIEADTNFWKPGEIKFRLYPGGRADFYLRDHSLSEETYRLVDGWILCFNGSNYIREFPEPGIPAEERKRRLDEAEGFYFKKLTARTALLCLSSFRQEFAGRINNLVDSNLETIESVDNLIIDIRNNGGGVYEAYSGLYPFILTDPLRGLGQEFLVTPTLMDEIEGWFDDAEGKQMARQWKAKFAGRTGEFVNPDTTDVYVDTVKPAARSPRQVILLLNRKTASSAEAFALDARQSKKVKLMGTPTYGALDYGTATFFNIGCPNYKLMLPTWRAARLPDYPIDNIGIQPDIYLDPSVTDWVKFCLDYLEGN
jgi:hypothetical protein